MRRKGENKEEKFLDITANMEGNLCFNDPVNLRINGEFKGELITKGKLVVGEKAEVMARIDGEEISVSGKITGDVKASKKIEILSTGQIIGDVQTPIFSIREGGIVQGKCQMLFDFAKENMMGLKELAEYLELELNVVQKWAEIERIPGTKKQGKWLFEKDKIDKWVSEEKVGA